MSWILYDPKTGEPQTFVHAVDVREARAAGWLDAPKRGRKPKSKPASGPAATAAGKPGKKSGGKMKE